MDEVEPIRRLPPRDVKHYALGFVKPMAGAFQIFGSGTLVQFGRIHGIITAGHVWDAIKNLDSIGFFQFPTRRSEIQATTEVLGHIQVEEISDKKEDELGADIAFLKLTRQKAADLERLSSFLNLEKSQTQAALTAPSDGITVEGIAGLVGKKGVQNRQYKNDKGEDMKGFRGLCP